MPTTEPLPVNELRLALTIFIQAMCDHPDAVSVANNETESGVVFRVVCAPEDVRNIIGIGGRTARALRAVLLTASRKYKANLSLDIVE